MGLRPPVADDWGPDEAIVEAMRHMGAPPADIAAVEANIAAQRAAVPLVQAVFPVWRCNWPTVLAFLGVSTQWMRAGIGGQITGLHYGNVLAWVDHHIPYRRRRAIFEGLQIMERAALDALAELPQPDNKD